ncbi:TetR/AcrR family transcriptional regulator [Cellulomonas hominis]|uniref:TetR/AcrR family transcriptional regulator n=1 Tax=Cellulomonas hominis TaxID=156981 RepID=UPI001B99C476|nr:TetR family transcriptional regulator [Cellulomonas hominis]VTR76076.1 Tetracycline repressor protein class D [Cellulomonas hominis]
MPAPRSRRERPAKPALTREGIVDAAVRLMEQEGLERVTMRRLATELDTGAASLYVYVANTAELHAAVLDRLLAEVDLRAAGARGWRERLDAVVGSYTDVLQARPALARSAMVTRPNGPHYLDLVETLLALLEEGDVPAAQAAWGVDLLLHNATAMAAEHAAGPDDRQAAREWDRLGVLLTHASPEQHPRVHAQAQHLLSGTPDERRRWRLQTLVNGILATPSDG